MQTETAGIKPDMTATSGDYDGNTTIEMFNRSELKSIRSLLETNYGVYSHNSQRLFEIHNPKSNRLRYRASGTWTKHREESGALKIRFDVGCYCEHDCCGHMCALSHTVQVTDDSVIVITSRSFNY